MNFSRLFPTYKLAGTTRSRPMGMINQVGPPLKPRLLHDNRGNKQPPPTAAPQPSTKDLKLLAVESLLESYTAAFNSHDASKVAALVTLDWTFVNVWGMFFSGRVVATQSYADLFKNAFSKATMLRGATNIRLLNSNAAVAVVEYDVEGIVIPNSPSPIRSELITTHTMVLDDSNKWLFAATQNNRRSQFPPDHPLAKK